MVFEHRRSLDVVPDRRQLGSCLRRPAIGHRRVRQAAQDLRPGEPWGGSRALSRRGVRGNHGCLRGTESPGESWRPGWCESDRDGRLGELTIVVRLCFGRRDIADRLEQPVMVGLSRCPTMDKLGLVQPVDRLGKGVVVAVALVAHRMLDACSAWTRGSRLARLASAQSLMEHAHSKLRGRKCCFFDGFPRRWSGYRTRVMAVG